MEKEFENKTIVITGATGGVGNAAVEKFTELGAKVLMIDVNKEIGTELKDRLIKEGKKAEFFPCDVSSEKSWERVVQSIRDNHQTINGLFNCAGIFKIRTIFDTSEELWDQTMCVNAKSVFFGIKHIGKIMVEQKSGSIVNMSSIASFLGSKDRIAYAASKGAVASATKAASIELAPYNVRVNSIHPCYVKTRMAVYASKKQNRTEQNMGLRIPLGHRICQPQEVVSLAKFLLSNESQFITGAEMVIDGGQSVN